jgi:hypothetical protein
MENICINMVGYNMYSRTTMQHTILSLGEYPVFDRVVQERGPLLQHLYKLISILLKQQGPHLHANLGLRHFA